MLLEQDTQRNMYHRECFWFVYQSEVLLLNETQPHTDEVCASVRDTEMGEGRGGGGLFIGFNLFHQHFILKYLICIASVFLCATARSIVILLRAA